PPIYTLSLHDALPICYRQDALSCSSASSTRRSSASGTPRNRRASLTSLQRKDFMSVPSHEAAVTSPRTTLSSVTTATRILLCLRSEEHTSELQSRVDI